MNIELIQDQLRIQGLDGWLFFDHHERDPLAYRVLGFQPARHVTRRWYYLIPANGTPTGLVHRIERDMLADLPGERIPYSSWHEQVAGLGSLLRGCRTVAMQYSPDCAIPYISLVDAGTVELVRRQGVEVVSSAELIQFFEARLDAAGMETHLEAGRRVDRIRAAAFQMVGERLRNGVDVDEFAVKEFVREQFARSGMVTDSGPIVGVNQNAGNPHYEPLADRSLPIRKYDFLLLDMWARLDEVNSVFYDITWTGFCGVTPPEQVREVFDVVSGARDRAIEKVKTGFGVNRTIRGFEVDDAARSYVRERGYADRFVHRTGHSIGREIHGSGANMDNLETHDERALMPWSCFSIEPGVYLDSFGVRSEINMFLDEKTARVTGEIQTALVLIE